MPFAAYKVSLIFQKKVICSTPSASRYPKYLGGGGALIKMQNPTSLVGMSILASLVSLAHTLPITDNLNAIDKIMHNWFSKGVFSFANRAGFPTLLAF